MKAEIVRLTAEDACEARTWQGLLIVFRRPAGRDLNLGDTLEFGELELDSDVTVTG